MMIFMIAILALVSSQWWISGPVMMKVGSRLKSRRQFRGEGSPTGSCPDQAPRLESSSFGEMVPVKQSKG